MNTAYTTLSGSMSLSALNVNTGQRGDDYWVTESYTTTENGNVGATDMHETTYIDLLHRPVR